MMMSSSISAPFPTRIVSSPSKLNHPKLNIFPSINHSSTFTNVNNLKIYISSCNHAAHSGFICSKLQAAAGVDGVVGIEGSDEQKETQKLIMQTELIPKHVALFFDGHRRWAAEKGLSWQEGYRGTGTPLTEMIRFLHEIGVKVFTIFGFSSKNWQRPKAQISIIGDTSKFPESLRKRIAMAEMITRGNKGIHLVIALSYGGREDILEATKSIATKVKDGQMSVEEINEKLFEDELQTKCTEFPSPDLFIRTGDSRRISNFMLWQMAYTEFYFMEKLFPALEKQDMVDAIVSYQRRQRCFGGHNYKS